MTSYFQDGGHDVRPGICICSSVRRLPAIRSAPVTLLNHCMRYSSWSIVQAILTARKTLSRGRQSIAPSKELLFFYY